MLNIFKNLKKLFYNYKKLKLNIALKTIIKDLKNNFNSYKELNPVDYKKAIKSKHIFYASFFSILLGFLLGLLYAPLAALGGTVFVYLMVVFLSRQTPFYFGWFKSNLKKLTKP